MAFFLYHSRLFPYSQQPFAFLVSGALLLGKTKSLSVIWRKRVFRFVVVLFVFSYISVLDSSYISGTLEPFNAWKAFKSILEGPVQTSYWFLYSYISFLVMLPLLRLIAKNMTLKDGVYLFFVGVLVMDGFRLCRYGLGISRINHSIYFSEMILFYPLLGYALENKWDAINNRMERHSLPMMWLAVVLGLLFSAWMTYRQYLVTASWNEAWITFFDPFLSVVLFVTYKKLFGNDYAEKHPKLAANISVAGGSMFGIYLLERILKRRTMPVFTLLNSFLPTIIACFLWLIVVMVFGTVLVWALKKIPGVKKFI